MRSFLQDLRFGLRQLRLSPGFALVGILSLALGIGANTAIFQLIDAIRLRAMPVANPEQLATVHVFERHWASGNFYSSYSDLSYPLWQQIEQRQQSFDPMAAWAPEMFNLAQGGETHYAHGLYVTGDFYKVLGLQPVVGRLISASDDTPGCSQAAAVLSYSFWQRNYGGDPAAIGKQISLNGYPAEIVGVTPQKFTGVAVGESFDVSVPVCAVPNFDGVDDRIKSRRAWWLNSIGRLKPGTTLAQAAAQMNVISQAAMEQTLPPDYDADGAKHYMAYKLTATPAGTGFSQLRRESETGLWLLMGVSALVLLIACANIANLMLARASARDREIAVRLAMGASRGRVIRHLLSESLLMAVGGALAGSFIAWTLSAWLINFLTTPQSNLFVDLSLDWRVLAYTTALACVTTMLFGLMPALKATKTPPGEALKSGGRGMTASREKFGLRRVLVVSQVALSLVLLVGALLFARSLRNLYALNPGFNEDGVLIAQVDFERMKIPQAQRWEMKQRLLEQARAIPGVTVVGGAMTTPLSGSMSNDTVLGDTPDVKLDSTMINETTSDYFKAMETPLLMGRDFGDMDTATSPKVAIVNQAFVEKFLKTKDPLGKTFKIQQPNGKPIPAYEVVGVVKNAVYRDMHEDFQPTAYFPLSQDPEPHSDFSLVVRSPQETAAVRNSIKDAMAAVSPEIDIDFHVFKTQVHDTLRQDELMATLTGFFGALAGLLAVIGLYGVISYMVAQRRNEIGVRMAMGAQRADVLKMVLRDAAMMVAIGLVVGTVLALFAAKGAATLLFGLKPRDPVTYIACIVGLAIVAVLASLIPARRAASLDPWTALRDE
jgi:putative ABC transport system permease protein